MRFNRSESFFLILKVFMLVGSACRTVPVTDAELPTNKNHSQAATSTNDAALSDQQATQDIPTLGVPTLGNSGPTVMPVLIFLGGYTSCKDPLQGFRSIDQTRAAKLLEKMRAALVKKGLPPPAWLLGCQFNNPSTFIYKMSTSPRVIRQSGLSELAKSLSSLTATVQGPEVYLVGHSYGGWAAMRLALSVAPQVKIRALVGVDPISGKTCLPEQFLDSILKKPAPGCTEAPSDITQSERLTLASRIRTWLNLYQLESRLLHSGAIANAENSLRRYPGRGLLAHGDIFDDPALDTQILALLPP